MTDGTPIDRDKLLSIGYLAGRSRHGKQFRKAQTDEFGNTVTEHWDDRQDVTVRVPRVAVRSSEERDR